MQVLNCVREPFLVSWKRHPPWFTKFEFEKFFSLFYIISTQRSYIYKTSDKNRCFEKLRAISNLFNFFYTPCSANLCSLFLLTCISFNIVLTSHVKMFSLYDILKCPRKEISKVFRAGLSHPNLVPRASV